MCKNVRANTTQSEVNLSEVKLGTERDIYIPQKKKTLV